VKPDYKTIGKLRRQKAIELGLCSRCYVRKPLEGRKYCRNCYRRVNPGYKARRKPVWEKLLDEDPRRAVE
jgi:hypothetical protein